MCNETVTVTVYIQFTPICVGDTSSVVRTSAGPSVHPPHAWEVGDALSRVIPPAGLAVTDHPDRTVSQARISQIVNKIDTDKINNEPRESSRYHRSSTGGGCQMVGCK